MSEAVLKLKKDAKVVPSKAESRSERELQEAEAIARVYRKYGSDLSAFYRDAHRDSQKQIEKRATTLR